MCINSKTQTLFLKFPTLLRDKLIKAELEFPSNMKEHYDQIKAYRCILRTKGVNQPVNRDDFRSNVEEYNITGKKKRSWSENFENDINYYGVSLFTDKNVLNNIMKLPRPNAKICVGYVQDKSGVQATDKSHINWWLYDNADIGHFEIEK